jgi:hypothetical protein
MPLLTESRIDTTDTGYELPSDFTDEVSSYHRQYQSDEQPMRRTWRPPRTDERRGLASNTTTHGGYVDSGPTWLARGLRRLAELCQYKDDWDSYQSAAISETALAQARDFLSSLDDNVPSPMIVPVPGGGIQFEWQVDGKELEIEIRSDGEIEYLKVCKDETTEESQVSSIADPLVKDLVGWLLSDQDTCESR